MNATNQVTPLSEAVIADLKQRYDPALVEAVLLTTDDRLELAFDFAFNLLLYGDQRPLVRDFLAANLTRRRNEAMMVEQEITIFRNIAKLMEQAVGYQATMVGAGNLEGLMSINDGMRASAELVVGLAQKNATMGEGYPDGGQTIPRQPVAPPSETLPPATPPSGNDPGKKGCYDQYKEVARRIAPLTGYDYYINLAQAIVDLGVCAGPSALKLIIDLINALKK
ncbi:MAG: hypothetical protein R3C14_52410 [Caldilineaceae bacterium]